MNSNEDHKLASDFQPEVGEANFPPPMNREVVGGMHIAPECFTVRNGVFVMTVWPNGLPRHEQVRSVRFPHGLMKFGETLEETAQRLVSAQQGLSVIRVSVLKIDSYVDEMNHWHLEPVLLVDVEGEPKLPKEAEELVEFSSSNLPEGSVWGQESFQNTVRQHVHLFHPGI